MHLNLQKIHFNFMKYSLKDSSLVYKNKGKLKMKLVF